MVVGVVLAIRTAWKRQQQVRAADEARLRTMAQVSIAAMKKKQEAAKATPPVSAAPTREERECPFCAELILAKAKVCKHCGRDVEPLA